MQILNAEKLGPPANVALAAGWCREDPLVIVAHRLHDFSIWAFTLPIRLVDRIRQGGAASPRALLFLEAGRLLPASDQAYPAGRLSKDAEALLPSRIIRTCAV
ncbi:MAG: hypothetical protein D1H97_03345 [Paracoccus sp. BP8]|nr:MAG: hypothetical protein D1H97_03345 [Paracoccus sp. BP8]